MILGQKTQVDQCLCWPYMLTVYNTARTVPRCLDSIILRQKADVGMIVGQKTQVDQCLCWPYMLTVYNTARTVPRC